MPIENKNKEFHDGFYTPLAFRRVECIDKTKILILETDARSVFLWLEKVSLQMWRIGSHSCGRSWWVTTVRHNGEGLVMMNQYVDREGATSGCFRVQRPHVMAIDGRLRWHGLLWEYLALALLDSVARGELSVTDQLQDATLCLVTVQGLLGLCASSIEDLRACQRCLVLDDTYLLGGAIDKESLRWRIGELRERGIDVRKIPLVDVQGNRRPPLAVVREVYAGYTDRGERISPPLRVSC